MKTKHSLLSTIVGCLMGQGCFGPSPLGEVRLSNLSTAMSGEVLAEYRQLFNRGFDCCSEKYRRRIITASGELADKPLEAPLLARDCSNSSSQAGLCIPVVQNENDQMPRMYPLPDGTRIMWNDSARPYALFRMAGSEIIWLREWSSPADAVREKTLLVIRESNIAEKLDIYTGEPLWSVEPPDEL